jgi:pimeloyl-ACP methyl ester carboxylesterase
MAALRLHRRDRGDRPRRRWPRRLAGSAVVIVAALTAAQGLTGANAPVLVGHSSGAAVVGLAAARGSRVAAGVVFLDGDATPLGVPSALGWLLIPRTGPRSCGWAVTYTVRHGIPAMTAAEFSQLRSAAVPKRVIFGFNDPQLSAAGAAQTAARIGAPPPTAVPGRHLTMISSPRLVGAAIRAFLRSIGHP